MTTARHLGEVGDGEDLSALRQAAQLLAECRAFGAADSGVGLVEDQRRPAGDLFAAGGELQGERNARQLAAGGDARQRHHRLAGVGGELEDDMVETVRTEFDAGAVDDESTPRPAGRLQAHCEARARERQICELAPEPGGELGRPGSALPAEVNIISKVGMTKMRMTAMTVTATVTTTPG